MSEGRSFRVVSKMSRLAKVPGGISARESLMRADKALATLHGPCLEAIDAHMAEIERRYGTGAAGRNAEPLEDLYTLSSRILDVGMGLPDSGIDDGARAICEMVARSRARGVLDWASVDVHLAALKLLRSRGQALTVAQRTSVLTGLGNVLINRVGPSHGPGAEAAVKQGNESGLTRDRTE